jgi:LPXTG-motif cell wall-anchored protein
VTIAVTQAQLAVGFGVIAGIILLLGRRRRRPKD